MELRSKRQIHASAPDVAPESKRPKSGSTRSGSSSDTASSSAAAAIKGVCPLKSYHGQCRLMAGGRPPIGGQEGGIFSASNLY